MNGVSLNLIVSINSDRWLTSYTSREIPPVQILETTQSRSHPVLKSKILFTTLQKNIKFTARVGKLLVLSPLLPDFVQELGHNIVWTYTIVTH